jgi:hypothetical protein
MKNSILKLTGFFILALIISSTGCKKGDADSQSAEDAARGSYIMADAFSIANDGQGGKLNKRFSLECAVYNPLDNGFEVIFNQCTDEAGVYRNGTIRVTASADAWNGTSSSVISITFENYQQDDEGISGTITAQASIGALGVYFTLGAQNLTMSYSNGDVATINSATLVWTITLTGLEFNGSSNGITRDGIAYSSQSENLVFGFCSWPVEGIITVNVEGENEITVNFDQDGNASCDNIYLVSQKRHGDVRVTF